MNFKPTEPRPPSLWARVWAKVVRLRYRLWLSQSERLVKEAFDENYYRVSYPDVVVAGEDPLLHYYTTGWREGRFPAPWFDPQAYRDSATVPPPKGRDPFQHCLMRRRQASEAYEREFQALRAKRLGDPKLPSPAELEIMREGFDAAYYLATYPDVEDGEFSPLMHYALQGWREGRDPSAEFSGRYYLDAHPDIHGTNPLLHYMRAGRFESWRRVVNVEEAALLDWFQSDPAMQARLAEAEALDPMVLHPVTPRKVVAIERTVLPRMQVAQALRQALGGQPFRYVLVIPNLGGAERAQRAAVLAETLARLRDPAAVLVLCTDSGSDGYAHCLPAGVQHFNISEMVADLLPEDRHRCVIDVLRGVGCRVLINLQSQLTWQTQQAFGRQMAQEFFLMPYMSGGGHSSGARVGYPIQWLRDTADQHHLILADSQALATDLRNRLGYRPEIGPTEVLASPIPVAAGPAAKRQEAGVARPRFLWAGSFEPSQGLDIVVEIARANPQFDFVAYERPSVDPLGLQRGDLPANLTHSGALVDLASVLEQPFSGFVYTAQNEGLPRVLLEMATAGLPLVAPDVGGIGELIHPGCGWLVAASDDVAAYSAVLHEMVANPTEAAARSARLQTVIDSDFSQAQYTNAIKGILNRHEL